uniref:(northern house mosquito) hypothetical protein n=2 Tax=Culex pipiens TaxID=7175 RepID=A0A8D8BWB8_CULPI
MYVLVRIGGRSAQSLPDRASREARMSGVFQVLQQSRTHDQTSQADPRTYPRQAGPRLPQVWQKLFLPRGRVRSRAFQLWPEPDLPVRNLRQALQHGVLPQEPLQSSLGRTALLLSVLRQVLPHPGPGQGSRAHPHRGEAIRVRFLSEKVWPSRDASHPSVAAHRHKAVHVLRLWNALYLHLESAGPSAVAQNHLRHDSDVLEGARTGRSARAARGV